MNLTSNPAYVSAAIYLTASTTAALSFFLVTTVTGDYTWVARLGGAGWVLLLSLIISMPTVTPWVKRRMGAVASERSDSQSAAGHAH